MAPRNAMDDVGWLKEMDAAEEAIGRLLDTVRRTRQVDPQREHVLHNRHAGRLRAIKRMCDAACA